MSNDRLFQVINTARINTDEVIACNANIVLKVCKYGPQHYDLIMYHPSTDNCIGHVSYKDGLVCDNFHNMCTVKQIVQSTATASNSACLKNAALVCGCDALEINTAYASTKLGKYQAQRENATLFSKIQSNMNSQLSFNQTQGLVMSALLFAVGMNAKNCAQKMIIANNQKALNMNKEFWQALNSYEPDKKRVSVVTRLENGKSRRMNFAVRWCGHDDLPSQLRNLLTDGCSNKEWCFVMGAQTNTAVAIAPGVLQSTAGLPIQLCDFFQDYSSST